METSVFATNLQNFFGLSVCVVRCVVASTQLFVSFVVVAVVLHVLLFVVLLAWFFVVVFAVDFVFVVHCFHFKLLQNAIIAVVVVVAPLMYRS